MKHHYRIWGILLLVFSIALPASASVGTAASAATGGPFVCKDSRLFQNVDNTLFSVTLGSKNWGTLKKNPIAYNAIGYNLADNYIYGMGSNGKYINHLIRISSDGSTKDMGLIKGLPRVAWSSGGTDNQGNLWVNSFSSELWGISIKTHKVKRLGTKDAKTGKPVSFLGSDLVFVVKKTGAKKYDQAFYSMYQDSLYKLSMPSGRVSVTKVSDAPATGANGKPSVYGAGWVDNDRSLYFSLNGAAKIYKISGYLPLVGKAQPHVRPIPHASTGPGATDAGPGMLTSNNDGANCNVSLRVLNAGTEPTTTTTAPSTTTTQAAPPMTTTTWAEAYNRPGGKRKFN